MRIALVIERFGRGGGGAERVAWRTAHELVRAGDDVCVLARRADDVPDVPGPRVERVPAPAAWQPLRVLAFSRAAARAARRGRFDVVYSLCRTAQADVLRAGAGCHADYLARRFRGVARGLRRLSPRHAALLHLERRAVRDARIVACSSEMVRRALVRRHGLPEERTRLLRSGVDLARFRPPDPGDASERAERLARRERLAAVPAAHASVWLFVGGDLARKGLDTALRALALAGDERAALWVAGARANAGWRRRAEALGLAERVRFLGPREDLPALYRAADGLLLPTRYDACANVCLEAAASGIPVVTSGADGASELLAGAGRVVEDPEDAAGFAKALDELADARTRARLGAAARAAVSPLGWDAHVRALRALLAEGVRV